MVRDVERVERDPDVVREERDLEEAVMVRFMVSFLVCNGRYTREGVELLIHTSHCPSHTFFFAT